MTQRRQHQRALNYLASFPSDVHPEIWPNQREALEVIGRENGRALLELPTGSGKTAIAIAYLSALQRTGARTLFYIVPTKALVNQIRQFFPDDVRIAYGRNEHICLYYEDEDGEDGEFVRADEVPCSMLHDCPHRVNQETGETEDPGEVPCPYLQQKWEAKQGGIVVCTASFYLFTQFFSREWNVPDGLVIDEVHCLARIVRNSLSYEITDDHLRRSVELLRSIGANEE
ncbi:MAG: DEAD/DEAH box helicase family protein, partial [Candidatus Thorarchaeota archaeon]